MAASHKVSDCKVSVLALGNWGTALANHLAAKGFAVIGWSHDHNIVDGINAHKRNPVYLKDVTLHSGLKATTDLEQALIAKYIVIALPSSALGEILPKIIVAADCVLISAIKGIEQNSLQTPLQYFKAKVPGAPALAVLSGPSFARDIVNHRPSGVVAASEQETVARQVADLFSSDWMKVYVSTDPLGVEIGGIVKNAIALAAGACDGLALGDSARAGLITRGLAEMTRLAQAMGADMRTLFGLAGLGDLVVTATSELSRNHTVGYRLGRGEKLADILDSLGSVAEGVLSAPLVLKLAAKHEVDMPIVTQVTRVLNAEISPAEAVKNLLTRPTKREFVE